MAITNNCIPPAETWGIGNALGVTYSTYTENFLVFGVSFAIFTFFALLISSALITDNPPDKPHPENPFTWKAMLWLTATAILLILLLKYGLGFLMTLISKNLHT